MLDGLGDVDDVERARVVENVVLREVCVHEPAHMEEASHGQQDIPIELRIHSRRDGGIFEARRGPIIKSLVITVIQCFKKSERLHTIHRCHPKSP